jgi:hypothetical protein
MKINYIRKTEATLTRQPRSGKYDEFRVAVEALKGDEALFVTGVKSSSLYSAMFPAKISVVKALYNEEVGYMVTKSEQDGN